MRIFYAIGNPLTAFVTLALLAGCSGGSQMASTPLLQHQSGGFQLAWQRALQDGGGTITRRSFISPNAIGKRLIFVPDIDNVVGIYLQSKGNAQVGQILGDVYVPNSVETDSAGNLYVASGASQTVPVFAPPYTKAPKAILFDTGYAPTDVAVSSSGMIAVANYPTSVTFYRKNSTKPCATVTDPSFSGSLHAAAFDHEGNLYVQGGQNGSNSFSVIGEIVGGCKATSLQVLTTSNTLGGPGGIKVDKQGRIAIGDQKAAAIFAYNPPTSGSLGSPVTTTLLQATPSLQNFAFVASGRDLYTADFNKTVAEYVYPAGGAPIDSFVSFSQATISGVAVTPPLVP
ncbi:MAG: hypothetical protein WB810_17485 [Candidatus Cybelea sp.]